MIKEIIISRILTIMLKPHLDIENYSAEKQTDELYDLILEIVLREKLKLANHNHKMLSDIHNAAKVAPINADELIPSLSELKQQIVEMSTELIKMDKIPNLKD